MKTIRLLAVVFALLAFLLFPSSALADDDDFTVDYDVEPGSVGPMGTDVSIKLDITNTGPTDITKIICVVNTTAGFSQTWTGTIHPGDLREMTFLVPFADSDLMVDRILQVAMNNNSSANPDGVKMYRFRVARLDPVISVSASVSPAKPVYRPGETISITHVFTNNSATHTATRFRSYIEMNADGHGLYAGPWNDHGNVFAGASVSPAFRYTIAEDAVGSVSVKYSIRFNFMGRDYSIDDVSLTFNLEAPRPEFTATLEAEPEVIFLGSIVKFAIYYKNTGDYPTDFTVTDSSGAEIASAPAAPAGWEGHTGVTIAMEHSGGVYFVVTGTIGSESVSIPTNTVHIAVRHPEPSVSSAPSSPASPSSASSAPSVPPSSVPPASSESASTSVPPEPPSPAVSSAPPPPSATNEPPPSDVGALSASPSPGGSAAPSASVQPANAPADSGSTVIYVLIGVVVLLIGAVIALFILFKKKASK